MSNTNDAPPEEAGSGAAPSACDKQWISALVDRLVPQFQAGEASAGAQAAMQTNADGK
ncbi:hypothetical protein PtA15_9A334 [Puccinia triticina]|uniref:Uncharacterized protein n=1 Tax=Puccinia triticina TaxID=208348 RepID=A0ABY7CUU0_9BASI|nr:uncharacterized protein PtA15_9A334 [Puccinia triticina]WAQ88207.1 hypothetical protein PtA15_9A334 [Puccinia triticina]